MMLLLVLSLVFISSCVLSDDTDESYGDANYWGVDEMIKLYRLDAPVISTGKTYFAYTQTHYEGTDSGIGQLLVQSVEDKSKVEYVCDGTITSPGNVAWLDDERFLFTAYDEEGINQIWYHKVNTTECKKLTEYPISVQFLKVSPTLDYVAFSAEVYYQNNFAQTAQTEDEIASRPYQAYIWTDPYIRHWDSWIEPNKWYHIFIAKMDFSAAEEKIEIIDNTEPYDIMYNFESDSPKRDDGDTTQFDISPDGKKISFITQTGVERAWSTDDMLYMVDIDINNMNYEEHIEPSCVTCDHNVYKYNEARTSTPLFITDDVLVFLAMEEEKSESDLARLVEYHITDGSFIFLSNNFDYSISSMILDTITLNKDDVSNPKYKLYMVVEHWARDKIFRYDSVSKTYLEIKSNNASSGINLVSTNEDGSEVELIYSVSSFMFPSRNAKSTFTIDSNNVPTEVYEEYTDDNENIFESDRMNDFGEFFIDTPNDDGEIEKVHSFYFMPKNKRTEGKIPLILYIHGGPESPWTDSWSYRWNPQAWVSRGYALLLTNFHGSSSFGKKFCEEILGDWFGKMYDDIINAENHFLEEQPDLDSTRIGTAGASFGCNTIFWILGHNDVNSIVNVCHDGVFDPRMSATDTEELFFPIREFGGFVFDPEYRTKYDEKNASLFVSNWKTPTLVIHGGQDFRIPESHGISAFQALRRQGVEAKFLYFPTQSHWVYSPQESVIWHNNVFQWLDEHLFPELDN